MNELVFLWMPKWVSCLLLGAGIVVVWKAITTLRTKIEK